MALTLTNTTKLLFIKLLHTLIWACYVLVIGYVVYAGVADKQSNLVWVAIGLVVLEGLILLLNKGQCPLTPVAARYTTSNKNNFDIFLPNWLARNNKAIFTTIFSVGVVLVLYRMVT